MILKEQYFKMSNAIFSYSLTPIQYAVYSYLVSLSGQKGKCWPSMKRIAACTLSQMLGHYSAGFTLDTYTHVTTKMQQEAAAKLGAFMEGTS